MKSYRITFTLILTFFLLVLISCTDFFELERAPEVPWSTVDEFERAPIGLYASLFGGDKWNIAWVNTAIVKNSMGDDVNWVSDASYGYWRNTKEFNTYTDKNIINLYRSVAGANNAIEFLEDYGGNPFPQENDPTSIENINRIAGEIYFIRAYAYYLLQTTFGHAYVPDGPNSTADIPMPTKMAKSMTEARSPHIGTTMEVYDLILADLLKAKELLPEKYIAGVHNLSYQVRANKFAAAAMLMRVYMQRGEYDKAKDECDFIIDQNGGEYALTEDPVEAFNKSVLGRGKEVVFYAPYYDLTLLTPDHLSQFNNTYENAKCNWVESRMSDIVLKRIGWLDNTATDTTFKIAAKRDKRFQQLFAIRYPKANALPEQWTDDRPEITNLTTVWPNKYYRGSGQMHTNVPLIRLAEIYLTRSVCLFRSGNLQGAIDDLDMVRRRAWDSSVGGPFEPTVTITEQIINDERLIEMFGEADRIDYLRSIKVDIPNGERGSGTVPYTSEDFVWAIPARETNYNDAL